MTYPGGEGDALCTCHVGTRDGCRYHSALDAARRRHEVSLGNNARRAELKGRPCEIVAKGKKGSVMIKMLDTGEIVITSWRAVG